MKKVTVFSSLFVLVFGCALGMTVMFHTPAKAIDQCGEICEGYYDCTYQTGPLCTANPRMPYYKYFHPTCGGGPTNCESNPYVVGCCSHPIPLP